MVPYLSWPAVSQISNLTVVSSKQTVCVKKADPIVDSCSKLNQFSSRVVKELLSCIEGDLELVELPFHKTKNQRRLSDGRFTWKKNEQILIVEINF